MCKFAVACYENIEFIGSLSRWFILLFCGDNGVSFLTAQVIMEIPVDLMLTISQKLPWMFFPDIIPVGHPIFDIINSTNPEVMGFSYHWK